MGTPIQQQSTALGCRRPEDAATDEVGLDVASAVNRPVEASTREWEPATVQLTSELALLESRERDIPT